MDERISALLTWGERNGAALHPSIEAYHDTQTGTSLRVKPGSATLPLDTQIVSCSYSSSLSYFNAISASPILHNHSAPFPNEFLSKMAVHVVSNFYLCQQALERENGFWWPYIQSLPTVEELNTPLFWTEDERTWLNGTNLEKGITDRENLWKGEWERGRALLGDMGLEIDWKLYLWAATIFSSRSFISSLLPLDIISDENEKQRKYWEERLAREGPFPVLFPVVDLANHSPTARVAWRSGDSVLSICADEHIPEGGQIFNNYGVKSNSELLLGYGFMLPENDEVAVAFKRPEGRIRQVWEGLSSYQLEKTGEPKTLFHIRGRPYLHHIANSRAKELRILEDGTMDLLAVMVANERELAIMETLIKDARKVSPEAELEESSEKLKRCTIRAAAVLCDKLMVEKNKILSEAANFG
jgi:hypothetical protein